MKDNIKRTIGTVKKKLVIVNGTTGVGKTAVCRILYKKIQRHGLKLEKKEEFRI